MNPREELEALRRLAELEAKAGGGSANENQSQQVMESPSLANQALAPIRNIPSEIGKEAAAGYDALTAPFPKPTGNIGKNLLTGVTDTAGRALGAAQIVFAPVTAAVREIAAKPLANVGVSAGLSPESAKQYIQDPIEMAGSIAIPMGANKYAAPITEGVKSALKPITPFLKDAAGVKPAAPPAAFARKAFDERRANFVQGLVMPKQTVGEIADTALKRSSGGGLLNKQVYTPDPYEADMIKTIASTGVKKGNPLVDNLQIINKAKNQEAQALKFALEKSKVAVEPAALNRSLQNIAERIAVNPLVDEQGATVQKILQLAQYSIDSNPKTAILSFSSLRNYLEPLHLPRSLISHRALERP